MLIVHVLFKSSLFNELSLTPHDLFSGLGWKNQNWGGGYRANTLYVYLLTSSIFTKILLTFGGGGKSCIRPYYLLLGGQSPPAPHVQRPCYIPQPVLFCPYY